MPREPMAISLVRNPVDPQLIQDLEQILERARAGEVYGVAWAALLPGQVMHKFSAGFAADLYAAIGVVRAMEQDLLDLLERP